MGLTEKKGKYHSDQIIFRSGEPLLGSKERALKISHKSYQLVLYT